MTQFNNKHQIFQHSIDNYLYIAAKSGFKYDNHDNKYVISGYPSANFNFFYLAKIDDILKSAIDEGLPFGCFPNQELENDFAKIAIDNGLILGDNVVAHKFEIDDSWHYNLNNSIQISKVQSDKELLSFDEISGECFAHKKGLAYDFLQKIAIGDQMCELYIGYVDGVPVGTTMISLVNNIAGIYWLGVLPNYRNKGIATELTNYIINLAKLKNHNTLISQNFTASQSLFKKMGFKAEGALPLYVNLGRSNDKT